MKNSTIPQQDEHEEIAVNVLLALGENLPNQADDELEENANSMPIGPVTELDQPQQESEIANPPDQPDTSSKEIGTEKSHQTDNPPETNEDTRP